MRATFHIKHPAWILYKSAYRECLIILSINRQRQSYISSGMTALIKIKLCTIPIPIPIPILYILLEQKIKP